MLDIYYRQQFLFLHGLLILLSCAAKCIIGIQERFRDRILLGFTVNKCVVNHHVMHYLGGKIFEPVMRLNRDFFKRCLRCLMWGSLIMEGVWSILSNKAFDHGVKPHFSF